MGKYVADISVYQGYSSSYLKNLFNNGVRSLIVKLTEGTNYINPSGSIQISQGFKHFDTVGVYHFYQGNPTAEAQYLLRQIKRNGLDKSTVIALDVESMSLPYYTTAGINVFLKYFLDRGYKNLITYGSGSWFTSGRINKNGLIVKNVWVASYGLEPAFKYDAWQFTDNYKGLHTDCSWDKTGKLFGIKGTVHKEKKKTENTYYKEKGKYKILADKLKLYKDKDFKKFIGIEYLKGYEITAYDVEKVGSIYRLKTKTGKYFTANKKFISKID